MASTEQVQAALAARAASAVDFFGGWSHEDVELFDRWAIHPAKLAIEPGYVVDWLGCRTDLKNYSRLDVPPEGGLVVPGVPIPNDSVHADAIEYVGLLTAVEQARQRGEVFRMIELGASYAPWCVFGGLAACRVGFDHVVLTAVEASSSAPDRIRSHARTNGLLDDPRVELRIVTAAIGPRGGSLYFPLVDTSVDNGAQASRRRRQHDYRGAPVRSVRVPAVTIQGLTDDLAVVDFVHIDVQGGELALLRNRRFRTCLREKVAYLMLATHSRSIEGVALEALGRDGWRLHRERPTGFRQCEATNDVVGWTWHDGAQLWANPRFG